MKSAGFATKTDLDKRLAEFATKTDLDKRLAGFATKTDLDKRLAGFATKTDLDKRLAGFATKTDLDERLSGFATKTDLDERLSGFATKKDIKNFATKSDLQDLRKQINDDQVEARSEFFQKMTKPAIEDVASKTKTELITKIENAESNLTQEIDGLKAELSETPSKSDFEKLQKQVATLG